MRETARIDKKPARTTRRLRRYLRFVNGSAAKFVPTARATMRGAAETSMQTDGGVAGRGSPGTQRFVVKALMAQLLGDRLADVRHIGREPGGRVGVSGARAVNFDVARILPEFVLEKSPPSRAAQR